MAAVIRIEMPVIHASVPQNPGGMIWVKYKAARETEMNNRKTRPASLIFGFMNG